METDKLIGSKENSSEATVSENVLPDVATKQSHVTVIVLITILAVFILVFLFFFTFSHSSLPNNMGKQQSKVQPTTIKQLVINTPTGEVTKDTIIAKSLDVQPLYPNVQWEDVTASESLKKDGINQVSIITNDYDVRPVSFKEGQYWKTKTAVKYDLIGKYYFDILQKLGWVDKLNFNTFKIDSSEASGACGGVKGMVGYKDGMVRTVTISHSLIPCSLPNSPDSTPYPSNFIYTATYIIFISDPIPLSEIASHIKNK